MIYIKTGLNTWYTKK